MDKTPVVVSDKIRDRGKYNTGNTFCQSFFASAGQLLPEIVTTPKKAYRKYVVQPKKLYGLQSFAIDSPQDVVSHCINHEIGHMVFNRSTLENKEKLLKNLWGNNTAVISARANANEREFFAEAFAIYEKGGILDEKINDFIDEIIK